MRRGVGVVILHFFIQNYFSESAENPKKNIPRDSLPQIHTFINISTEICEIPQFWDDKFKMASYIIKRHQSHHYDFEWDISSRFTFFYFLNLILHSKLFSSNVTFFCILSKQNCRNSNLSWQDFIHNTILETLFMATVHHLIRDQWLI